MNKKITYIFRKRLPQYNSIEELFSTIEEGVSEVYPTGTKILRYSGASPIIIIKNLFSFKKKKNDLQHITGDIHYMAIVTGNYSVLTIHDVKSASSGNILKTLYIRFFWFWLPAFSVRRITVISEFTKRELSKIIPFAKDKIRVVNNPVNAELKPSSYIFNSERPNILLIGTKPNKNLERIFEALENYSCQLTIIGELSSNQAKILQKLNIDFKNKKYLLFEDVISCYENCDLLCFPSIYEGFGMPIIEAQAIGRPVLTSNFGAMLEISGDSACLVDPFDVGSIKNGIYKICNDENYRQELINKGFQNIERFQIQNITKQYIAVYNEVFND